MSLLKEYGIEEDERFVQAKKEALRVLIFVIVTTIIIFSLAVWGESVEPADYPYIMGMPAWFFWAFVLGCLLFPLIAIFLGTKIADCDLTDEKVIKDVEEK
jgi:uncharacterized membrane protein YhdT